MDDGAKVLAVEGSEVGSLGDVRAIELKIIRWGKGKGKTSDFQVSDFGE